MKLPNCVKVIGGITHLHKTRYIKEEINPKIKMRLVQRQIVFHMKNKLSQDKKMTLPNNLQKYFFVPNGGYFIQHRLRRTLQRLVLSSKNLVYPVRLRKQKNCVGRNCRQNRVVIY